LNVNLVMFLERNDFLSNIVENFSVVNVIYLLGGNPFFDEIS